MTIETVFVSVSSYVLGRAMGITQAVAAMHKEVAHGQTGLKIPALETIKRLRDLAGLELLLDSGSAHMAKNRSRQFSAAYVSTCDAWISLDDDVELSTFTLRALLEALEGSEPRIIIVPCLIRRSSVVNVEFPKIYSLRRLPSGGECRRCNAGGFGAVGINRMALEHIAATCKTFVDDDGQLKFAPFSEHFAGKIWLSEDLSFFASAPKTVMVEALLTGETCHDGQLLQLQVVAEA